MERGREGDCSEPRPMTGAAWQTVGFLSQLAEEGKGKEVMLMAQVSLEGAAWRA